MANKNDITSYKTPDSYVGNGATYNGLATTSINGIEGLPYQFLDTADRRIVSTNNKGVKTQLDLGRKYTERIFSRLPLVFFSPGKPLFCGDQQAADALITNNALLDGQLKKNIPYYQFQFDFAQYYFYLNAMLTSIAVFLGINTEKITLQGTKKETMIGNINWATEENPQLKTFVNKEENIAFYADSFSEVSESFGNDTTSSQLASMVNGFSDQAKELKYLFGENGSAVASMINSGEEVTSSITNSLSGLVSNVGGGILGSITNKGVNSVLNGGKIIFPELWSDSSYDKSISLNFKFRSPDSDNLSIFLNVIKPYCKLLALVMPRLVGSDIEESSKYDVNAYSAPFLVKAFAKGMFNIDMGIITSLSVNKGGECRWNDSGLPTQIDVSVDIKDLYRSMAMSSYKASATNVFKNISATGRFVANTSYMNFLANNAGVNAGFLDFKDKFRNYYYLLFNRAIDPTAGASDIMLQFKTYMSKAANEIFGWK